MVTKDRPISPPLFPHVLIQKCKFIMGKSARVFVFLDFPNWRQPGSATIGGQGRSLVRVTINHINSTQTERIMTGKKRAIKLSSLHKWTQRFELQQMPCPGTGRPGKTLLALAVGVGLAERSQGLLCGPTH